jgi:pSer/pThr/pTyr-binding forkhead associated (FHA) protein
MIVCPNCQHENLDGTVFCDDCGIQITGADPVVTQNISLDLQAQITDEPVRTEAPQKDLDTWASLHLLESGQILPLSDRTEFTLGRISDAQPIRPDIDLTPYQAYASGVSRLHAVLKREGAQVSVKDLGSSNGTYLNGKRLKPNVDQTLQHGDLLSLGKLKIQILLKNP